MKHAYRPAMYVASLLVCLACSRSGPRERNYPVTIRSVTDEGEPMASIPIRDGGHELGATDARGVLRASLAGNEGSERRLAPVCPPGFHGADEPTVLQLRTLGATDRPRDSEVEVRCLPDKHLAALLVSTPGFSGLPVLVHGREVGRTDAAGIAHLALKGEPHTPLRVVLDTSARPLIAPVSPHKDVRIGTRDEIVVFAPSLTESEPPRTKTRAPRPPKVDDVAPPRPEQLN